LADVGKRRRYSDSGRRREEFGPTRHLLLPIYSHIKNQKLHCTISLINTMYRVFQKELYNFESLYKCIEYIHNVLNYHNVAKHTEFYLG
jgi:hypothetical protein